MEKKAGSEDGVPPDGEQVRRRMRIAETPRDMRSLSEGWRKDGQEIGLVPTMGALHEGHLALLRAARSRCDRLVASVFVNPTQFGAGEDFDTYARPFERDVELLQEVGCDALFAPNVEAMYGGRAPDLAESGNRTFVDVGKLGEIWEGAARPGHLRGVATVVAMLFNIAAPHRAYFGEKDYQQLKVVQRMVRDLFFGVEVVPCPTVREADGLAMSSRNANLTREERGAAAVLHQALDACVALARGDGERDAAKLVEAARALCEAQPLVVLQYIAVVDAETLESMTRLDGRPARALISASIGGTHLIDNVAL